MSRTWENQKGFSELYLNLSIYVVGAALVHVLMLALIREHESLFAKVPLHISARPPEGLHASPSALRHPHLHPLPCFRQLSLPLIAQCSRDPGQAATDNPRYNRPNLAKHKNQTTLWSTTKCLTQKERTEKKFTQFIWRIGKRETSQMSHDPDLCFLCSC